MGLLIPTRVLTEWTPDDLMVHDLCLLATIWNTLGDMERRDLAVEILSTMLRGEAAPVGGPNISG